MSNISIHRLAIDGASKEIEGNLHYYDVTMLTQSLNSRYFSITEDALKNIAKQIRTGRIRLFQSHDTYRQMPSGRAISASVEDGVLKGKVYVQEGLTHVTPNTTELIEMIDAGTVGEFSPTISGGKMTCDQSGLEMRPKYGWFSHIFEDADGNRLGQQKTIKGRQTRITAKLSGDVKIHELSVVGIGATPDTDVLQKLEQELNEGHITQEELPIIAELGNFDLNNFCTQLSVDPIQLRRDPMEKDKDLIERENEQLQKDNDRLQTELAEAQTKLEEFGDESFTKEEYDALVKERDELKEAQTKLEEERDTDKDMKEIGRTALKYAREEYVAAEVSLNSLNADQEAEVAEYVSDKDDFLSLMRTAKSYRKRAAQNKAGGPKARSTYESPPVQTDKPKSYNRIGV